LGLDLYAEEIISHYEHPHNKGKIADADTSYHDVNPLCGDDITVYIKVADGKISDIKFDGIGCAISVGSASMLTDMLKGKPLAEVEKMDAHTVIDLLGIDPGPSRLKCATLSLKATQKAVFVFEKKDADEAGRQL
jgi:nitrogen fixation NifU-like protein